MAACPNCGKKLHIYNWKQNCPHCGVNLVYYKSNEHLLAESEKTEIEHARFQPGVDRAKASTIGSFPAIMRIVLSVLPLGALMLPLAGLKGDVSESINAVGIYKYVSASGFGNIIGEALKGNTVCISVVCLLLSAVLILVAGLFLMKSLGKHGKTINLVFDSVKFLLATASAVLFTVSDIQKCLPGYQFTSGKPKFGIFIYIGLFLALLIYSRVLAAKGLVIKHSICLIGGIPSDEYFKMVEDGVSELEIRREMVRRLTEMQNKVREEAALAQAREEAERANRK
ncbi:MAG: hypothetical protein K6F64_06685 [Clostridia bacterium]|nr:hypothetical protein [Clostridia bacterium]